MHGHEKWVMEMVYKKMRTLKMDYRNESIKRLIH
jgi:hypothetical protein